MWLVPRQVVAQEQTNGDSTQLGVRVPTELWDRVKARCEREDRTVTSAVRQALRLWLEQS